MNHENQRITQEIYDRLRRVETKLIRGFEELGIDTDTDPEWLTVDDASRTIYVRSLGRSLAVTLTAARRSGATQLGKPYEIVHRGDVVGTLILRDYRASA